MRHEEDVITVLFEQEDHKTLFRQVVTEAPYGPVYRLQWYVSLDSLGEVHELQRKSVREAGSSR
jgi:hypothetical protein